MSDTEALVYVHLNGVDHLVGRLWSHQRNRNESASFQYDDAWMANPERFALEPALEVGRGAFHTESGKALFGALGDSAPDRWGRTLMLRAERKRADEQNESPRTLREVDFLLNVTDEARQGALRFKTHPSGPFIAGEYNSIPPLVELPRLLDASDRILADDEDFEEHNSDLRLLLAPGSSLGGARPKASIRDTDGALAIAKFPKKNDELNAVLWEQTMLDLAARAGIQVPASRVHQVGGVDVLLLDRFDRNERGRIPFLSAMSMLGASDHEQRSYMEIADALRMHGSNVAQNLRSLWRRIVFNVLTSNTDDHLRNHGFLYVGDTGWTLSPAYDMNPVPTDVGPRILSTAIDLENATASVDLAMSVASYFELSSDLAEDIAHQVANAVAQWRSIAAHHGIKDRELKRMQSAFDHVDSRKLAGS